MMSDSSMIQLSHWFGVSIFQARLHLLSAIAIHYLSSKNCVQRQAKVVYNPVVFSQWHSSHVTRLGVRAKMRCNANIVFDCQFIAILIRSQMYLLIGSFFFRSLSNSTNTIIVASFHAFSLFVLIMRICYCFIYISFL